MNLMRFFITIFIFLVSFSTLADECKNFENKVLAIPPPIEGLVTDGQQEKNDLGLFFHKEYVFEDNIIKIKRDKNNYPVLKISFIEDAVDCSVKIVSVGPQRHETILR